VVARGIEPSIAEARLGMVAQAAVLGHEGDTPDKRYSRNRQEPIQFILFFKIRYLQKHHNAISCKV
jgi:hypothetical protein